MGKDWSTLSRVSMVAGKLPYMTADFLIASGSSAARSPAPVATVKSAGLGTGWNANGPLENAGLTA